MVRTKRLGPGLAALTMIALAAACGSSKSAATGPGTGGATHGSAASAGGGATTGQGGAGASGGSPSACAGVTCSGHGTCAIAGGQAACTCAPGFHAVGVDCAVDETCAGDTCGTCAMCEVKAGLATCTCPQDYVLQGKDCVLASDPCATANCMPDEACVPEAHCQALAACVPTCDCSNCPNCSPDNSDGKWNDQQEYCGAPINTSPATMACAKPCPGGMGCLPYATQICWPLEGCFSL
jgi:hypothetical protein